ncbi:hypothetical protein BGZ47_007699 [Haplosporangium gracile]|nr:hypothetical protein BGZ47_007699 [Haplosporangium gracile]
MATNPFKVTGYNPLMMLAEGPYPSADTGLEKRVIGTCDPGYSFCTSFTAAGGVAALLGSIVPSRPAFAVTAEFPISAVLYNSCTIDGNLSAKLCAELTVAPTDVTRPARVYCCSRGMSCRPGSTCVVTTATTGFGSSPTNIGFGGDRSAGSVRQASVLFTAVMAAATIVFDA